MESGQILVGALTVAVLLVLGIIFALAVTLNKMVKTVSKPASDLEANLGPVSQILKPLQENSTVTESTVAYLVKQNQPGTLALAAYCYEFGFGVEQDAAKAEELYLKAAALHEPVAKARVALFREGKLIPKEAIEYFRKMFLSGRLVELYTATLPKVEGSQSTEVHPMIQALANSNDPESLGIAEVLFETGVVVSRDLERANELGQKARDLGNASSICGEHLKDCLRFEHGIFSISSWLPFAQMIYIALTDIQANSKQNLNDHPIFALHLNLLSKLAKDEEDKQLVQEFVMEWARRGAIMGDELGLKKFVELKLDQHALNAKEAIKMLEQEVANENADPELLFVLGSLYLTQGFLEESAEKKQAKHALASDLFSRAAAKGYEPAIAKIAVQKESDQEENTDI